MTLVNGTCTCSLGKYIDTSSSSPTCEDCHNACLACSGPNKNNCTQCKAPTYYKTSNGECTETCPDTTFKKTINNSEGVCEACSSECRTCDSLSTNCTSCESNYKLYNNTCIASCPTNTFVSNSEC